MPKIDYFKSRFSIKVNCGFFAVKTMEDHVKVRKLQHFPDF